MIARGRQSGLLAAGDLLGILAAVPVAARLRLGTESDLVRDVPFLAGVGALHAAVFLGAFHYSALYELRALAQESVLLARVARAAAAGLFVVACLNYLVPSLQVGRGFLLLTSLLVAAYAAGSRAALRFLSRSALYERILILGGDATAAEVGREIGERRRLGYRLVATIDRPFDGLVETCQRERIDRVLVCVKDRRSYLPYERLLEIRASGVEVEDGASFSERLTGKIPVRDITPSWFIFGPGFRQKPHTLFLKRAIDVVVAAAGLLVSAPILLATAIAIRLESKGPALFRQERVGRGRTFELVKFRSMRVDAERDGPRWAAPEDDRITRVGRLLRKTRIDELPQLWNVLKGEMSLVGPRPERPFFVRQLARTIPFYEMRHVVRPGCTGWAQVRYRYGASEEDALQKLQYDLHYIKHLSIRRDLLVIFDTFKVMLLGMGR